MNLEFPKIFDDFFKKVKDKYPDVSYLEMQKICKNPFVFFNHIAKFPTFPEMRFKYLGIFSITKYKAIAALKQNQKYLAEGLIDQEKYDSMEIGLNNIINRNSETTEVEETITDNQQQL